AGLLLVAENAVLAARRLHPVAVWLTTGVLIAVYGLGPYPDPWLHYGPMVALYTVAAHSSRSTSRRAAIVTAVAILTVLLADWGSADVVDWTGAYVTSAAAWLLGENVRTQRAYAREMAARAEEAERRRQDEARRAVAEERLRLARELHDVTAHHVSVMAIQAEAGQALLPDDPGRAAETLARISASARQALGDLRRLLGALRDDGDPATETLSPQPGLAALPKLAEEVSSAGVPVDVRVEGEPGALGGTVDVSAYRIVQEALTNVLRHAPGARADVVVRYEADEVEIEVANDGAGNGQVPSQQGRGHGLVGMRERAAMLGGRLEAGPGDGGRFVVRAWLPR
ncbi:MAG: sensor histidine kinase, partial [Actinomycetota bacterium]|nr:sensor histidine kinase [Actinomycetota bacterium]